MSPTRFFSIVAWILLPTVMFGGYSLLNLLIAGDVLTPFQVTFFRAGHAHAGVLLAVALLYHIYLDKTALTQRVRWAACAAWLAGALAVSGGFFLHMAVSREGEGSVGTLITTMGAIVLALDSFLVAYGLIKAPREATL